jgi:hypothetical protein
LQPHQTGLKVRCRSAVASAPKFALQILIFFRGAKKWSLPPVLPRHDFFTKEIHRLLQGGINGLPSRSSKSEGWSQSPVLPWAQRAYDARLSADSTAVLPHGHKTGAPTRSCTELASIPKKCIAQNALGAVKLESLTGFAPVISCMRGRHVVWTTPQGRRWSG